MVIAMKTEATVKDISAVLKKIHEAGLKPHVNSDNGSTIIGIVGWGDLTPETFAVMPGVARVAKIASPFKLASREFKNESSIIQVDGTAIGGKRVTVMAGPCAIESRDQFLETALCLREMGVTILRGGAYKPRTSPYSFQGLKEKGLEILAEVKSLTGMAVVSEVLSPDDLEKMGRVVDIFQIGARNMQNFLLLEAMGKTDRPVLLKRGMMSTIEEWLMAAEYILANGNPRVILCERGIRTFEKYTRNTFDIAAIPILKKLSHLPVIADPSHGTGVRDVVIPASRAALAAGADGLLIEMHPDPDQALSDGAQSLNPQQFAELMRDLRALAPVMGREL